MFVGAGRQPSAICSEVSNSRWGDLLALVARGKERILLQLGLHGVDFFASSAALSLPSTECLEYKKIVFMTRGNSRELWIIQRINEHLTGTERSVAQIAAQSTNRRA